MASRESYKPYVRKVWNAEHTPRLRISSTVIDEMELVVYHIFDKIAKSAKESLKKKKTFNAKDIQDACRRVVPGALGVLAVVVASRATSDTKSTFTTAKAHRYLRTGQFSERQKYAERVSRDAAPALAEVIDEMTAFILRKAVSQIPGGKTLLQPQHLTTAIQLDEDIRNLLQGKPSNIPRGPKNTQNGPQRPRPTGANGEGTGQRPTGANGAGTGPRPTGANGAGTGPRPTGGRPSASTTTGAGGANGRIVIVNSVADLELFLSQNGPQIRRVLQSEYSKRRFLLSFHPDKCIASVESLHQLFAQIGKTLVLNISGTQGCDAVFKRFSNIY